jgi:PKD repeat protein
VTAPPPPNQPPTAAFTPNNCTGLTCSFTDQSTDPDGSVTSWSWSFGDNQTATQQNPSHTYSAGGTYTVTLTVKDNVGASSAPVSHTVSVTAPPPPNQPPTAAFTPSCPGGLTCSFADQSTDPDGSVASWQWSFGDGSSATTRNPSHTYTAGGSYTVTLTVKDNVGASSAPVSHTVSVTAPPPPNQPPSVTAGPDQDVLVGLLFTLSGASFSDPDDNGPWTITIDWGDGRSDTFTASSAGSISRSHSYPVTLLGASYQLRITVRDPHGATGSDTKTVVVRIA